MLISLTPNCWSRTLVIKDPLIRFAKDNIMVLDSLEIIIMVIANKPFHYLYMATKLSEVLTHLTAKR